ncbi:MAG: hypothetical protein U1C55_12565 [Smithellaceae bacterium]|nr:hypothetical protein [Smithellaceae bacterium]
MAIFNTFLEFIKRINRLLGPVVIALLLMGCSLRDRITVVSMQDDYAPFHRVAVLTFQHVPADAVSSKGPKIANEKTDALPDRTDPDAARIIQEIFVLNVQGQPGYYLVDEAELGRIYRKIAPDGLSEEDRAGFFRTLGKEMGVDGLITGNVYRFRDRKGRSYSAQSPASVAFEIGLVRTSDGAVVWRGIFDKTQKSLLENLLDISSFYRQRGRWVTARELAEEGIEDIIQRIPVFR